MGELIAKGIEVGQRFGNWTVLKKSDRVNAAKERLIEVVCVCGRAGYVQPGTLKNGRSAGCGCIRPRGFPSPARTHGLRDSGEYRIWTSMKSRCYNKGATSYCRYGAKGIGVCTRWRDSFEAFYRDMGLRPSPDHSLHRKTNGDYSPENTMWAPAWYQSLHRGNTRWLTIYGLRMCVADWERCLGTSRQTIIRRMEAGVPPEEIGAEFGFWPHM